MRSTRPRASSRWLLGFLLLAACGGGGEPGGQLEPDPLVVLGPGIESIVVEIDYMEGAAPYTGAAGPITDIWSLWSDNIERIFLGTGKVLTYPRTLPDMEQLTSLSGPTFNAQQVLDIATAHRGQTSGGTTASYYFVFLDGVYEEGGQPQTQVLGISLSGRNIVAVFKPVVAATGVGIVPRVVEQTVLVHEFGHAIGLVNNGVPLTSDHHDTVHGAHCTNMDCVMYFANEGGAGLRDFVDAVAAAGSGVLFGQECLDDTDAITGGGSSPALFLASRTAGSGDSAMLVCECDVELGLTRYAWRR
ncbi:MAG: hypothetical protein ACYTGN_17825 [Planctomycetota bacterium]|jgi:hypothetical protein